MTQTSFRRAILFAASLTLAAGFLYDPRTARGHAKLLRSEPQHKARLPQPPNAVELWFSGELQSGFNAIEVKNQQGSRFESGEVTLEDGGKKVRAVLRDLPAGEYTVEWKALSIDEHTLKGSFVFTVEAPAAAEPAASQPPQDAVEQPQATHATPGVEFGTASQVVVGESAASGAADSLVRWLGYLSMMALAGGFASWLFVFDPTLRSARGDGVELEGAQRAATTAERRSLTLLRLSVAALILSTLLALVFQSMAVHGVGLGGALAPSRLAAVIGETNYGKSWLIQAVGAAALLVIMFLLGRAVVRDPAGRPVGLWVAGLAASVLVMLGPSLTGHAAAASRYFPLATLSDWLHLVAGAFWVGGLFHLALVAPTMLARSGAARPRCAAGVVIARFTRMAIPSAVAVSLAGLYSSWIQVGGLAELWGTAYGRTLLVKLLLVVLMMLLGAVNGFFYGPRLASAGNAGEQPEVARRLSRSVRLEAALGALVLLVAAVLVFQTPGRHEALEKGAGAGTKLLREFERGR